MGLRTRKSVSGFLKKKCRLKATESEYGQEMQQPPTSDEPLAPSKEEEKLHDKKCDKSNATCSLLSNEMIAKQESTLSNAQQNRDKIDTS